MAHQPDRGESPPLPDASLENRRREVEAALEEGEPSLREYGPIPAEKVFARLLKRLQSSS